MAKKELPKEKITFQQLLTNPAGKGSANLARRDEIITNLKQRAAAAVAKKPPELAAFKEKDGFVVVMSIPSEEYDIYFDVVLRFIPPEDHASKVTLNDYQMQFFSNSPNANFTYGYVLEKDEWNIPELRAKWSKRCLEEPPVVRNPAGLFGFEKTVMFAALLMVEYRLHDKRILSKHIEGNVDWKAVRASVKSFDEKMAEYDRTKARAAAKVKAEKAKAKKEKTKKEAARKKPTTAGKPAERRLHEKKRK